MALEYGMSLKDFWEGDRELIYAYQVAYVNRIHNQAYLTGLYVNEALNTCFYNMFKKKSDKSISYPQKAVYNPFESANTKKESKSYIESIDTTKNNNELYNIKSKLFRKGG